MYQPQHLISVILSYILFAFAILKLVHQKPANSGRWEGLSDVDSIKHAI